MIEEFLQTKINDSDIDIYNVDKYFKEKGIEIKDKFVLDISTENDFSVEWELGLELRNWGVKSIDIKIKKIKGTIIVKDLNNDSEHTIIVDSSKDYFSNFKIEENIKIYENHSIRVDSIEIDFKHKVFSIS